MPMHVYIDIVYTQHAYLATCIKLVCILSNNLATYAVAKLGAENPLSDFQFLKISKLGT